MITEAAGLASVGVSFELDQVGMKAVAKPNSMLSDLIKTMVGGLGFSGGEEVDEKDYSWFAWSLKYASTREVEEGALAEPSLHDLAMEEKIHLASRAVRAHVSFARNVALPIVTDYMKAVQDEMAASKRPLASEDFHIEKQISPEPLVDSNLLSSMKAYQDAIAVKPAKNSIAIKQVDKLLDLLLTGDAKVDSSINEWFARKGEGFFARVFANLISDKEVSQAVSATSRQLVWYDYEKLMGLEPYDRVEIALAGYLFANKLFDNVEMLEDGANLTLTQYQTHFAQLRDFCGTLVVNGVKQLQDQLNAGILVLGCDEIEKTIRVNGELYSAWLKEGGKPELLCGLLVSGRRYITATAINENSAALQTAWDTHCMFFNASEANRSFDRFKTILENCFVSVMNNLTDEEQGYVKAHDSYFDKVNKALREIVDNLTVGDMDHLNELCIKLVCRTRFYYTASEQILMDIHEAKKINPNIKDTREAALIATSNYVGDFIADQIALGA